MDRGSMTASDSERGSAAPSRLAIVVASTRPGRVGWEVGRWFNHRAEQHRGFDIDLIDLADVNLPMMDEPKHPRLRQYTHAHTKAWSSRVGAADAFVFVMPEYNHGFVAPLKNALDYLYQEWQHKPVGFVSYGGVAAGTRAVQMLKPVLAALKMVPLPEAVPLPNVRQLLDEDGRLRPAEPSDKAAMRMLDELVRWTWAMRALRP